MEKTITIVRSGIKTELLRDEMEMCYSDCSVIATYSTESSRYSISANRDDKNVTGCCRGRKIRVRAID